jgi:hypothetical protein
MSNTPIKLDRNNAESLLSQNMYKNIFEPIDIYNTTDNKTDKLRPLINDVLKNLYPDLINAVHSISNTQDTKTYYENFVDKILGDIDNIVTITANKNNNNNKNNKGKQPQQQQQNSTPNVSIDANKFNSVKSSYTGDIKTLLDEIGANMNTGGNLKCPFKLFGEFLKIYRRNNESEIEMFAAPLPNVKNAPAATPAINIGGGKRKRALTKKYGKKSMATTKMARKTARKTNKKKKISRKSINQVVLQ